MLNNKDIQVVNIALGYLFDALGRIEVGDELTLKFVRTCEEIPERIYPFLAAEVALNGKSLMNYWRDDNLSLVHRKSSV